MTMEDVQKNAHEKRLHNAEVMQEFFEKAEGKTVGILNRRTYLIKEAKSNSLGVHMILLKQKDTTLRSTMVKVFLPRIWQS